MISLAFDPAKPETLILQIELETPKIIIGIEGPSEIINKLWEQVRISKIKIRTKIPIGAGAPKPLVKTGLKETRPSKEKLLTQYLDWFRMNKKYTPSSIRIVTSTIKRFLQFCETNNIVDITQEAKEQWIKSLKVAQNTVATYRSQVGEFLRFIESKKADEEEEIIKITRDLKRRTRADKKTFFEVL